MAAAASSSSGRDGSCECLPGRPGRWARWHPDRVCAARPLWLVVYPMIGHVVFVVFCVLAILANLGRRAR